MSKNWEHEAVSLARSIAALGLEAYESGKREERAKVKALREALAAAKGYLLNAHIDLETGAPKRTAINTLSGGIRLVREALAATSDPIEAPSDVHPQESGQ